MVTTFKSGSSELPNLSPGSLPRCDRVTRVDWIRDFWTFTLVESSGYLGGKLGFLDN